MFTGLLVTNCMKHLMSLMMSTHKHRDRRERDQPFTMHLCTEIDLEVFCIVKNIEKGAALVKLGNAGEENSPERVSRTIIP